LFLIHVRALVKRGVASKAQACDQVIVSFNSFSLAAAPVYMRRADRPILCPAVLAGNCAAGF